MANFDRAPLVAGFDQLRAQISDQELVAKTHRAAALNLEARAGNYDDPVGWLQDMVDMLGLGDAVLAIQIERKAADR